MVLFFHLLCSFPRHVAGVCLGGAFHPKKQQNEPSRWGFSMRCSWKWAWPCVFFFFFQIVFFLGTATWICFSISMMLWEVLEIFNIRLNRMSLVQAIGNLASCQAIGSGALMGPSSKLISWLYFGWFLSVLRWFEIQSDGNAHCVRDFIIFFKPLLFNSSCWLK